MELLALASIAESTKKESLRKWNVWLRWQAQHGKGAMASRIRRRRRHGDRAHRVYDVPVLCIQESKPDRVLVFNGDKVFL